LIKLILFLVMFIIISLSLHIYAKIVANKNRIQKNSSIGRIKLKATNILTVLIIAIVPSLLAGFRAFDVGTDTSSYVRYFNYSDLQFDLLTSNEYFFWKLFEFSNNLFNDVSITFFLIAFLTYGLAFIAIFQLVRKEHVGVVTFIYLCLFYQEGFNIIRQMLALSIILLAIPYILERKRIKYILLVIVGTLFHISALVCIPMYWIYQNKKITLYKYIGRIMLLLIFIVFFEDIFLFITKYDAFSRFSNYENQFIYNDLWWKNILLFSPLYFVLILMNKSLKNNKKMKKEYPMFQFYWFLAILYITTSVLRLYVNWVFRIGYYFELGILLYIGAYINTCVYKRRYLYMTLVIMFFTFYYFFLNYYTNFDSSALINYKWIIK